MPELVRLEHYGFTYPQQTRPALSDVELTIRDGEFWVLCGTSGCGKTTLLRQLKPSLRPHGAVQGCVWFDGQPLEQLPPRRQAADIGFVLQSPEEQTVTDKVWHELAFGLESLGYDTPAIRRRRRWRRSSAYRTGSTGGWTSCPADRSSCWRWPP